MDARFDDLLVDKPDIFSFLNSFLVFILTTSIPISEQNQAITKCDCLANSLYIFVHI